MFKVMGYHPCGCLRHTGYIVWCASVVFFLYALSSAHAEQIAGPVGNRPATTIRFLPQWSPQAQFAGYYVAYAKGMYAERGLDVRIMAGGPHRDPLEMLRKNETDIITAFLSGAIMEWDQGHPLVHLTQVVNTCNLLVVAWKDLGISKVTDLEDRRVSLWGGGFGPPLQGFFRAQGVKPESTPQYYSINLFLWRGVHAAAAMTYNEYHAIYQAGINFDELATFPLRDYGFDFPEDGIYCAPSFYAAHKDACAAFAQVSLEGWQYAYNHQEEALDIVMQYVYDARIPTNRPHMRWMLKEILKAIIPAEDDTWEKGILARAPYENTAKALVEGGVITSQPSYEAFTAKE